MVGQLTGHGLVDPLADDNFGGCRVGKENPDADLGADPFDRRVVRGPGRARRGEGAAEEGAAGNQSKIEPYRCVDSYHFRWAVLRAKGSNLGSYEVVEWSDAA